MSRFVKFAVAASALTLIALSYAWSQPGAAGRGGGGSGGFGVATEQVLGYLALDPEIGLSDQQLVQLRNALRTSYRDQLKLREEMRSAGSGGGGGGGEADFQRLREEMMALREGLTQVVKANLSQEQFATFTAAQERMQQGGRGQGGRRGAQ